VQKLTGCIAALGRFMSRSADKCHPFFKVLKRKMLFGSNEEAEEAFQKLKEYLGQLPRMVSPNLKELLLLYLAVFDCAVSAVLVAERNRQQYSVYYISHVLTRSKSRYLLVEKFAYALLIASRKLRPYLESHPITVLTDQPLRSTLEKYRSSGRMVKWAVELAPYGINYEPRRAMKAQALADFIAECLAPYPRQGQPDTPLTAWTLYVDGSATSGGSGARVVVVSPTGRVREQALKFLFNASNHEAEYEALPVGMDLCCTLGAEHLCAFCDSQLIVSQVMGEYEARDAVMVAYWAFVKERAKTFRIFEIKHVPRSENR